LGELNIDIICADSPQAKGRVERMHKTLQDRLVKELRLEGVATIEAGNALLPRFMEDFNGKFGKPPSSPHNAHRPLAQHDALDRIFCLREVRTMTANLVVRYDCNEYVVTYGPTTKALVGRRRDVELHRWADGRLAEGCKDAARNEARRRGMLAR
jgi:hypothetical protein